MVVPEEAVVRAVLEGEVMRYRPSREATGLERRGVSLWEGRRDRGVGWLRGETQGVDCLFGIAAEGGCEGGGGEEGEGEGLESHGGECGFGFGFGLSVVGDRVRTVSVAGVVGRGCSGVEVGDTELQQRPPTLGKGARRGGVLYSSVSSSLASSHDVPTSVSSSSHNLRSGFFFSFAPTLFFLAPSSHEEFSTSINVMSYPRPSHCPFLAVAILAGKLSRVPGGFCRPDIKGCNLTRNSLSTYF